MSSKLVYVVLTRRRGRTNNQFLAPGVYEDLNLVSGFIAPYGPPLPLIIQCHEDEVADLLPINEAIDNVGGGDLMGGAETFVKAMIAQIRDLNIWSHKPLFYALVQSPYVKKFISPDYSPIADSISGTRSFMLRTAPTFIRALIYLLANGNEKLIQWGLSEWTLQARQRGAPTPKALIQPSPSTQQPPPPPTPTRGLISGASTTKGKAKSARAQEENVEGIPPPSDSDDDDDEPYMVPGTLGKVEHAYSRKKIARPQGTASTTHRTATSSSVTRLLGQMNLPDRLVPEDYLDNPRIGANPVAFITHRPPQHSAMLFSFTETSAPDVPAINASLRRDGRLPAVIVFYLRAHGWNDSVVGVVASAYARNMPLHTFLSLASRSMSIPLTEASFLWHVMQYLRPV